MGQKLQNPKQSCRLPSHASLLLLSMQGEEIESVRETSRACEENVTGSNSASQTIPGSESFWKL